VSTTIGKKVDLNSIIDLVRQCAEIQATERTGQSSSAQSQEIWRGGGLFPADSIPSSNRPRARSGAGQSALEIQMAQMQEQQDRTKRVAVGLVASTVAMERSTKDADDAREALEAFQQMLERRVMDSMGDRSTRRHERRLDQSQQFSNDRDYWWRRDVDSHYDRKQQEIDYQRLHDQLLSMR
jgi:hypothetical protein